LKILKDKSLKQANYDDSNRVALVSVLQKQYAAIETSHLTQQNIEALKVTNTFTVYYGTSIELFYWPLYFLYKIISTINLTKELKAKYPYNFVPIYWMATEDHDFEEINYFNFKEGNSDGTRSTGPVGLSTEGLSDVFLYCTGTGFKHQCGNLEKFI
jgi:uncharacterized protein YllA (UPF0747 family)